MLSLFRSTLKIFDWQTRRSAHLRRRRLRPSHMYPHLAVIHELVRRGHRVNYLVGGHLADLAGPTGANVVECTSVLPGAPGASESFDDTDPVAGMRIFLDEAVHVLPKVHAALAADRPDLVLYDIGGMAGHRSSASARGVSGRRGRSPRSRGPPRR